MQETTWIGNFYSCWMSAKVTWTAPRWERSKHRGWDEAYNCFIVWYEANDIDDRTNMYINNHKLFGCLQYCCAAPLHPCSWKEASVSDHAWTISSSALLWAKLESWRQSPLLVHPTVVWNISSVSGGGQTVCLWTLVTSMATSVAEARWGKVQHVTCVVYLDITALVKNG